MLKTVHDAQCEGTSYWEIDGQQCMVYPPNIRFDAMPKAVLAIKAHLYSSTATGVKHQTAPWYPNSQLLYTFAYQGNVDVDSWVNKLHQMYAGEEVDISWPS